ncbi:hypothetical protein TanjilG_08478 [Lupinus angustifolius]|uniref:Dof zinc finger protein n=1 Tax=Lupinus angustifolius TaxID=3871 RepID=A0A1J7H3X8_LUPAN|nr:PREDICTED: dof zinc finger protein DOF5.1-like [Lupinus angustifolius]OIW07591.1 hypothetical protein TanjilG_08478 [Lupinus angustifolius]
MVYTSIPAYIDPANWQQQQPNHHVGNNVTSSHLLPPPPPPLAQSDGAGAGIGSIRPGSLADRARMANIPMQEAPQKCPRCESTNTKFCYFNNYSLSQPRHFCKTCRRYWTRGGALRSVPVGGGCRRNKRSKGTSSSNNSSKSSPVSSDRQALSANSNNSISSSDMVAGLGPAVPPQLRYMSPLHQLGDNFASGGEISLNYGLNYGNISSQMGGVGDLSFHIGNALGHGGGGGGGGSILSAAGLEQWRVPQTHQFPFLTGLESSSHGLYHQFEGGSTSPATGYGGVRPKVSTSGVISQMASVKMEESGQQLNLSREFLGMNSSASEQYWSTSGGGTTTPAWTNLSGFNSTSNQL